MKNERSAEDGALREKLILCKLRRCQRICASCPRYHHWTLRIVADWISIESKLPTTVVHFVIVLYVFSLVLKTSGILSLCWDDVELTIQIDSSLITSEVGQSVGLVCQTSWSVLFKVLEHHTVVYELLYKLQVFLLIKESWGWQSLHWTHVAPSQTNKRWFHRSICFRCFKLHAIFQYGMDKH